MDIKALDRRSMAETAVKLQFLDPDTGKPLDGVIGMIKGAHARSVQAALSAKAKAELITGDVSKKTLEELQQDLVQSATLVTASIEGVTDNGVPIDPARFYDLTFFDLDVMMGRKTKKPGSFAQQAMKVANETANFLTSA